MKNIFRFLFFLILGNLNFAIAQNSVSIEEIDTKLSKEPKYMVIELFTDWCGVCAIQHKKIQKDEELINLLENEFYYLRFNAESKETFVLNKIKFENKDGKIHEFTNTVSPDSNAFPAWVIMNSEYEIIFQQNELIEADNLKDILLKLNNLN